MTATIQLKTMNRPAGRSLLLAALALVLILPGCTGQSAPKEAASAPKTETPRVNPALGQKRWVDMTAAEKEVVLNAIMKSDQEPYRPQRQALEGKIMELFRQQMQLPATLEFEDLQGNWVKDPGFIGRSKIENVEEGTFKSAGNYRADNDAGQKVLGNYSFTFRFDGQALTVIDSHVK
jgi:hypothetical protein